jgi:hypothetical protein
VSYSFGRSCTPSTTTKPSVSRLVIRDDNAVVNPIGPQRFAVSIVALALIDDESLSSRHRAKRSHESSSTDSRERRRASSPGSRRASEPSTSKVTVFSPLPLVVVVQIGGTAYRSKRSRKLPTRQYALPRIIHHQAFKRLRRLCHGLPCQARRCPPFSSLVFSFSIVEVLHGNPLVDARGRQPFLHSDRGS